MKRKKNIKFIVITFCVALLLLAGAAEVTRKWKTDGKEKVKKEAEDNSIASVMDESNIGSPTGDDPWQEMEKLISVYYGGQQQVTYKGMMRLIDDNDEKQKLLEELNFEYTFFKGQYYYQVGSLECVGKDKFLLMVNHDDKTISLSSILPAAKKNKEFLSLEEFKKIMLERSDSARVTQSGSDKILTINNIQDPTIQGYQIYYDPATYRIRKMLIGMIRLTPLEEVEGVKTIDEAPTDSEAPAIDGYSYVLEINYEKTNLVGISENDFHPEKKFIRISGNHVEPTEEFKEYRLLN